MVPCSETQLFEELKPLLEAAWWRTRRWHTRQVTVRGVVGSGPHENAFSGLRQ